MAKKEPEPDYGGYNHEFVGKIADRFNCQICTKVIREPRLAVCCGQHFCESCLNKWFTRQGKKSCPHCRAEGGAFNHVLNKGLRSEINQLKIKCSSHGEGCEWTGELGELKTHLESEKGCGFVVIECPNMCTLPMQRKYTTVMRKDVEKHLNSECPLRPYQCEHCGLKDTYKGITGIISPRVRILTAHYAECPVYRLTCPNKCGVDSIKRKDMADHRSKCPQEHVICPFTEAGCKNSQLRRHQLDDHLSSKQQHHLLLVMGAYKQLKEHLRETEAKLTTAVQLLKQGNEADKETIDSIVTCLGYLKKVGDVVIVTMPRVSEYHRSGKIWYSAPFYFKEGYKMCLAVSVKNNMESGVCTDVSVGVCLLKGEYDDQMTWPIATGNKKCRPLPLPLPLSGSPFIAEAWFHMCPLQQLQQTNKQLCCPKGMCFHLMNDCLTFAVQYFAIYDAGAVSNTKSCDHLKVKVKYRRM